MSTFYFDISAQRYNEKVTALDIMQKYSVSLSSTKAILFCNQTVVLIILRLKLNSEQYYQTGKGPFISWHAAPGLPCVHWDK